MVKNIILHLDDKMFYKMKKHKAYQEAKDGAPLTWENYIRYLFGIEIVRESFRFKHEGEKE